MIKVLIVEDSRAVQELLAHILASDPAIQVAGIVNNGLEAIEAVKQKRPDVVTMDIHMPRMDGFEATRQIMETQPTPIVIVSGSSGIGEAAHSFRAMEAGALAVVPRPPGISHPGYAVAARELLQSVKLMSEIKVVTRKARVKEKVTPGTLEALLPLGVVQEIKVAAIGGSTGGPVALQQILAALPAGLPFPLLIVQHIAEGFTRGFVEWLAGASGFPLRIAAHGESTLPGCGYVAPDGVHMGVDGGPRIVLSNDAPEHGLRPSIAHLFRSVAQDQASSVIFGMPGEAIKLDAAAHVLPPEGVAALLAALGDKNQRKLR